jgi:Putative restriction endonuclease
MATSQTRTPKSSSATARSLNRNLERVGTVRVSKGVARIAQPKYDGLKMSLRDFNDWDKPEDGWKYEWNNGIIEVNETRTEFSELFLVQNIIRAFSQTVAYTNRDAMFAEAECPLPVGTLGTVRHLDLGYFTNEQIKSGRTRTAEVLTAMKPDSDEARQIVPAFVIEIISTHDKVKAMQNKLDEYFAAGVRCVWYIHPTSNTVEVYSSRKTVQICNDDTDVCSAAPGLDFAMTVAEIFA